MVTPERLREWNQKAEGQGAEEIIQQALSLFAERLCLASSFGGEDQVLTDLLSRLSPKTPIITLDTGRLFEETYRLMEETRRRYPNPVHVFYPDTASVETMVREKGINLFYQSVENRKLCCRVRKVEPLKRALQSFDAWICGLRREQSVTRQELNVFEWDEVNEKVKISPLAAWTLDDVRSYVKKHDVPVNPLHAKGFISIGCACCTRAVKPGEDIRAGRWWWETPESKECGLHANPRRDAYLKAKKEGQE